MRLQENHPQGVGVATSRGALRMCRFERPRSGVRVVSEIGTHLGLQGGGARVVTDSNMVGTTIRVEGLRAVLWGILLVLGAPWGAAEAANKYPGNPYIEKATRLYEEFRYAEALRTLEKAARWPSNTPEQNVSIALLEGVLRFELLQPEQAESAFKRALAIDLKAQLALTVSPKITETLERIREEVTPPPPPPPPLPELKGSDSGEGTQLPTGLGLGLNPHPPGRPGINLSKYRLPIAFAGGGVALMGALSWARAKSLEQQVRVADPSITTRAQLEGSLRQGRTFETVGWVLLGTGAATAVGSFLLLDPSGPVPTMLGGPTKGGAQVSFQWSTP